MEHRRKGKDFPEKTRRLQIKKYIWVGIGGIVGLCQANKGRNK
jgi:hypothetical protein